MSKIKRLCLDIKSGSIGTKAETGLVLNALLHNIYLAQTRFPITLLVLSLLIEN